MLLAFYVLFLLFFPQHIDTQKFNWNKKCCADLHWAGVLETLHSSTMSWDSCAIKWKFSRHAKKYFNLHETDVTSLTTVPSWNLDDHKAGAWFNVQKGILTHFDLLTKCGRKRIQFERWENWFIKFNFTLVLTFFGDSDFECFVQLFLAMKFCNEKQIFMHENIWSNIVQCDSLSQTDLYWKLFLCLKLSLSIADIEFSSTKFNSFSTVLNFKINGGDFKKILGIFSDNKIFLTKLLILKFVKSKIFFAASPNVFLGYGRTNLTELKRFENSIIVK